MKNSDFIAVNTWQPDSYVGRRIFLKPLGTFTLCSLIVITYLGICAQREIPVPSKIVSPDVLQRVTALLPCLWTERNVVPFSKGIFVYSCDREDVPAEVTPEHKGHPLNLHLLQLNPQSFFISNTDFCAVMGVILSSSGYLHRVQFLSLSVYTQVQTLIKQKKNLKDKT